ncbi:hypothetical protein ABFS82_14G187200 [Erythranthe guttata]|uniref:probable microtubule-binding protein TANGLED n=1 Tax=Erythranthe guttata TaxID=4155 RepID=UPI00064D78CA|nr:PREDICTED: probable microtubule-binding protein TANGLED [Erythranthe guttata]|eukprot:XP_012840443.1 PREDICTED: probable microtubule-binding protein TANGLED [Erythranthe guttata]
MVARTPAKQQRKMAAAPPLSPTLLRETVKKVDKCMARLQELQHTVKGVGSSPINNSSRSYLRTSLRCKNESPRMKNANSRKSPTGKLPQIAEEWRKMSLPAMLLGETMSEILQATQFARNVVDATIDDPKTPLTEKRRKPKPNLENSGLESRRRREKQAVLQTIRSDSNTPSSPLRRAKSRINFKASPLVQNRECDKENCRYIANRVSPRNNNNNNINRAWARKTVLFPNPLFHSSPKSRYEKFCKTKSPVISRNRQTPHKFLIKSPTPCASKFQVRIKSPSVSISPPKKVTVLSKKSPKAMMSSSSAAAKLRRSFSPSRLANRLMSPLKGRKSEKKNEGVKKIAMSGVKQRPVSFSIRFSPRRI